MRNAECNGGFQPAGWKTREGILWFPTVDGFVSIDPSRMAENRPPPAVVVEQIVADGREFAPGSEAAVLAVAPGRGNLEFQYTGLSFLDSGSIRFRYLLEGFDETWREAGTRRTAYYTNVPPGRYRFRVSACNNAGAWNEEEAIVALRLAPHYYQSWWFFAVCAVAIALVAYALHRYRVNRILELERVRTRIATDLHDDIGSSLSQIAILSEVLRHKVPPGDPSLDGTISQIAGSSRELVDSMSDIVWAINPKRDNLDDLVFRMRRFASDALTARNIAFSFRAPSGESALALGPDLRRELYLVFKESLNNVIRHSDCDRVEIVLETEGGRLVLTIRDDGRGFDTGEEAEGQGLASMARRAERLGGTFRVESNPAAGTTVTLEMPL
jgi:signal transduction histidine kinase